MLKIVKAVGFLKVFILPVSFLISMGCTNIDSKNRECNESGVVAHWTFDSISDNKINDKTRKHSGVMIGNCTGEFIREGLYRNAAFFDRGRNYIQIPHNDDLSLTDNFTIKCVFMPFEVNGFKTIIWKGNRTTSPEKINYFVVGFQMMNPRLAMIQTLS